MIFEVIRVDTYNGFKSNEKPSSFIFQGKRWRIAEIIDRWYDSGIKAGRQKYDYFKILTDAGQQFILRYNEKYDSWAVKII